MGKTNLLFLPGLLEDARAFRHQVDGLADIASSSVADLTRADSMAGLARSALEAAPAGPLAIAGHSMGGYVALEIARQAPGRVAAIAFLNTHARPDSPESTENRRRLMALAEADLRAVIDTLVPKLLHPDHLRDESLVGLLVAMALAVGKEAFVRQQKAIIGRVDSRPHLAAIRCPTLVVAGRDDALMPVELLEELALGIEGSQLTILEKCGHDAPLERPREVTECLRQWLGALEDVQEDEEPLFGGDRS